MTAEHPVATITILVDDKAGRGLLSEHGFSAWLEVADRHLLFDTGQGRALARNADKLGMDLCAADTLVLSHGHQDHTGGLPSVIQRAPAIDIYAHPAVTSPRYSIRRGSAKSIGMPQAGRSALEAVDANIHWVAQPLELVAGVSLTGPIPRITDYEDTGGPFFVDSAGARRDPISDDLALLVRTDRGLVVVVGCSHAGVVNTLRHAVGVSGGPRLHAVLGGFHLIEAGETRLSRTMLALGDLGPDLIVPCHCTGEAAVERLRQTFGERVVPGSAGSMFRFGRSSATSRTQADLPPV
jgi:7,8-dihydropterin-6-yl-methyl-4-(beta-D-ribofuranosyl)aminobenzene 5'-phosphate synthase